MIDLQKDLRQLRTDFNAIASAVISRDGLLISADIPEGVTAETFTIMCATMMGAASTAHSELKIGQPKAMRVISEKYEMLIVGAGRKALVVCVVPLGTKTGDVLERIGALVSAVNDG